MLRLRDIMTTDVLTVSPETSIREAMELLGRHHVSGAPVVSGLKLVGVVSANDLMTFASALPGAPTERDRRDAAETWDEPSPPEDDDNDASRRARFSRSCGTTPAAMSSSARRALRRRSGTSSRSTTSAR